MAAPCSNTIGTLRPFLLFSLAAPMLAGESPLFMDLVSKGDAVIRIGGNSTGYVISRKHNATMQKGFTERKCSFFDRVVEATRRRRSFHFENFEEPLVVKTFPAHHNVWTGIGMSFLAGLSTIVG